LSVIDNLLQEMQSQEISNPVRAMGFQHSARTKKYGSIRFCRLLEIEFPCVKRCLYPLPRINKSLPCSILLYVMRVLRGHGISTESLHDVFRATILAKITYCLPAWSGLCLASDRAKLDSFLNRCKRLGFCDNSIPSYPPYQTFLVMLMTHYLKRL